ncbi:uncharacterized protein LOC134209746 [Armigeres subalbatus]|uniref:uncharacterized protein LOC134209746 n=1 Tax=Armigeres subalbatus TaxID=124917 RepID=UPI002ED5D6CB
MDVNVDYEAINIYRQLGSSVSTSGMDTAPTRSLRVYYQNTRGLSTKLDDVYLAVLDGEYDVYVFTETWLDGRINSLQLFGDNFVVYRVDRSISNSSRVRGGGVLVAVSNELISCQIAVGQFNSIETVWAKISLSRRSIFIGASYIPPDRRHDCSVIQLHLGATEFASALALSSDVVLLLGDFNQPGLVWSLSHHGYTFPDPLSSTTTPASRQLVDGIAFLGLSQINRISNFQSNMLDLVFINDYSLHECTVLEAPDAVVPLDNYHPALDISIDNRFNLRFDGPVSDDRLNFRKTDFQQLRQCLSRIDWNVLDRLDIESAVDRFNCLLRDSVSATVPKRKPPRKPPWTNALLRNLKRVRARALRAYTYRRCAFTKRNFNIASNDYRQYNKLRYKHYVHLTQQNLRRHPKKFWSFVNSKRKETGLPSSVFLDNDIALNTEEKCSLFAKHFSSVFSSYSPSQDDTDRAVSGVPSNVVDVDVFDIDVQMVLSAISQIKSSFSPGPSVLPSAVLKKCSDILAVPLCLLFNLSLQQTPCQKEVSDVEGKRKKLKPQKKPAQAKTKDYEAMFAAIQQSSNESRQHSLKSSVCASLASEIGCQETDDPSREDVQMNVQRIPKETVMTSQPILTGSQMTQPIQAQPQVIKLGPVILPAPSSKFLSQQQFNNQQSSPSMVTHETTGGIVGAQVLPYQTVVQTSADATMFNHPPT